MFDAHRHLCNSKATKNALYATSKCSEWPRLLDMGTCAIGGVGILPSELPFEEQAVYEMLTAHPHLHIAEVGLDRRHADKKGQLQFLSAMLHIGFELGRSVSLHCVREDGALMALLRNERHHLPPLLWHGCTASIETIAEAVRYMVIPSFGPRFFKSTLCTHIQRIQTLPFALETDFTGPEEEYERVFAEHTRSFSKLGGLSEERLERNNDEIRAILTHNQASR